MAPLWVLSRYWQQPLRAYATDHFTMPMKIYSQQCFLQGQLNPLIRPYVIRSRTVTTGTVNAPSIHLWSSRMAALKMTQVKPSAMMPLIGSAGFARLRWSFNFRDLASYFLRTEDRDRYLHGLLSATSRKGCFNFKHSLTKTIQSPLAASRGLSRSFLEHADNYCWLHFFDIQFHRPPQNTPPLPVTAKSRSILEWEKMSLTAMIKKAHISPK